MKKIGWWPFSDLQWTGVIGGGYVRMSTLPDEWLPTHYPFKVMAGDTWTLPDGRVIVFKDNAMFWSAQGMKDWVEANA